jgi:hypothetical protein
LCSQAIPLDPGINGHSCPFPLSLSSNVVTSKKELLWCTTQAGEGDTPLSSVTKIVHHDSFGTAVTPTSQAGEGTLIFLVLFKPFNKILIPILIACLDFCLGR